MQRKGNGCKIDWLKERIASPQLIEVVAFALLLITPAGMKYGRKPKKIVSTESDSSTGYRTTSKSPTEARRQDPAPQIGESAALDLTPIDGTHLSPYMKSPTNTPLLLPETLAHHKLYIPPIGNGNYRQQRTFLELPESTLGFQSGQLSPGNIDSNILHLKIIPQGNYIQLPSPRDSHFVIQGMKTLSALLTNARMLRIRCKPPYTRGVMISSSSSTLSALSPTELQLRLPHFPYIDLLPFPSMRDKLLTFSECIDRDEIWSDLATGGFTVWGKTPWDKRGWEVHTDFGNKWWWLMTDEVLDESNFWKIQRGEELLDIRSIKMESGYSPESISFLKKCIVI